MKNAQLGIIAFLAICLYGCNSKESKNDGKTIHIGNIVDLTHTLNADFPFIPVKKLTYPFELIPMATLNGNGVEANTNI